MVLDALHHAVSATSFASAPADSGDSWQMTDYFATSCPHCQHLKPDWDSAASEWSNKHYGDNVNWVAKECLNEKWQPGKDIDECRTAGIQGFPTVRLLHMVNGKVDGEPIDYLGSRQADDMIQFIKDNMKGPSAAEKEAGLPLALLALPDSTGEILKVPRCRRDFL